MLSSNVRRRVLNLAATSIRYSAPRSVVCRYDDRRSSSTNAASAPDNSNASSNDDSGGGGSRRRIGYHSAIFRAVKKAKYRPKTALEFKAEREAEALKLNPVEVEYPPLPSDQRPGKLIPYLETKYKMSNLPLTEEDVQLLLDNATTKQDAHWILRGLRCCRRGKYILTKGMAQKAVTKILELHPDLGGILILQNFTMQTGFYFTLDNTPIEEALENALAAVERKNGDDDGPDYYLQHRLFGGTAALWDQIETVHQLLCYRKSRPYNKLKKGKAKKYHTYARVHHGPTPAHVDLILRILLQMGPPKKKRKSPRRKLEEGDDGEDNTDEPTVDVDDDTSSRKESVIERIERQILKPCIAFRVPVMKKTWDMYEQAKEAELAAAAAAAEEEKEDDGVEEEKQDDDGDDDDDTMSKEEDEDVVDDDSEEEASELSTSNTEQEDTTSLAIEQEERTAEAITNPPISLTYEEKKAILDKLKYRGGRFVALGFIRQ